MAEVWNEPIISKSSNGGPVGRPETMYFLPHLFDCQDYSDPLEDDDIDEFLPAIEEISPDYSEEFGEFAEIAMTNKGLAMPVDVKSCLNLYLFLLEKTEEFSYLTTLSYEYSTVCVFKICKKMFFFSRTSVTMKLLFVTIVTSVNYEFIIIILLLMLLLLLLLLFR